MVPKESIFSLGRCSYVFIFTTFLLLQFRQFILFEGQKAGSVLQWFTAQCPRQPGLESAKSPMLVALRLPEPSAAAQAERHRKLEPGAEVGL